jgi:hypothetical protein
MIPLVSEAHEIPNGLLGAQRNIRDDDHAPLNCDPSPSIMDSFPRTGLKRFNEGRSALSHSLNGRHCVSTHKRPATIQLTRRSKNAKSSPS